MVAVGLAFDQATAGFIDYDASGRPQKVTEFLIGVARDSGRFEYGGTKPWLERLRAETSLGQPSIYARFDGMEGSATDSNHSKWVNVLAVEHSLERPVVLGPAEGESRRGDLSLSELVLIVQLDRAAPLLADALARGLVLENVDLSFTFDTAQGRLPYLEYDLRDVFITSWDILAATDQTVVAVGLAFGKMEISGGEVSNPPSVERVEINRGEDQRSSVFQVSVFFDALVNIDVSDGSPFRIVNVETGDAVVTDFVVRETSTTSIDLTFPIGVDGGSHGSLPDGKYRLVIDSASIRGHGQALDGDGDGIGGGDFVFGDLPTDRFFRKYGDVDGDGVVGLSDFAQFRRTFGSVSGGSNYVDYLDADRDGVIGLKDFAAFRSNFGR